MTGKTYGKRVMTGGIALVIALSGAVLTPGVAMADDDDDIIILDGEVTDSFGEEESATDAEGDAYEAAYSVVLPDKSGVLLFGVGPYKGEATLRGTLSMPSQKMLPVEGGTREVG